MGYHKRNWLSDYYDIHQLFYKRYVDDIFLVFNPYHDKHPNIKFTMETETNK